MSVEWQVALLAGSDPYSPSPSHEDPDVEHPGDALPVSPHSRWRRDALQPPQAKEGDHFPDGGLWCVSWNTWGLSSLRNREFKTQLFWEAYREQQCYLSPEGTREE